MDVHETYKEFGYFFQTLFIQIVQWRIVLIQTKNMDVYAIVFFFKFGNVHAVN